MKKAVFTVCVDNYLPELTRLTLPSIRAYAERIGASFHLITERKHPEFPPTYEKTQIFELGRGNDVNILIDADIAVSRRMPDVTTGLAEDEVRPWMRFPALPLFAGDPEFAAHPEFAAIASTLLVVPRACHEFWRPLEFGFDEASQRCKRKFIIDEYCFSRNALRNDFRITALTFSPSAVMHVNYTSEPIHDPIKRIGEFLEADARVTERRAVVTLTVGDYHSQMAQLTHPTLINYAGRTAADFLVLNGDPRWKNPHFQKVALLQVLEVYDRVIYFDTDIIVREDTPDLFDRVPADQVGLFEEGAYTDRTNGYPEFLRSIGFPEGTWNGKYYNTGVMVVSQGHRSMFQAPPVEWEHFFEQGYLNAMLAFFDFKVHDLDPRFNRMAFMDWLTGETRHASYVIHYAGAQSVFSGETLLQLIAADLDCWKQARPNFRFKRQIRLWVDGTLADQLQAEPVIRALYERDYREEHCEIISDHPELFAHIGAKIRAPHGLVSQGHGFLCIKLAPEPFPLSRHRLEHAAIEAGIMVPNAAEGRIRYQADVGALVRLAPDVASWISSPHVLIDPDGIDPREFPSLQALIDRVQSEGFPCCLVGESLEPLRAGLDLRGRLAMDSRLALAAFARRLVTGDSFSLAVASAQDCWICVIPGSMSSPDPAKVVPARPPECADQTFVMSSWDHTETAASWLRSAAARTPDIQILTLLAASRDNNNEAPETVHFF